MKVDEAKQLVLGLMKEQQGGALWSLVQPGPPGSDPGKFLIDGRVARVIHHYSGWHVTINPSWFDNGFDPPMIHQEPFYWYVFALPRTSVFRGDHYFICDYLQMRDWVLSFASPRGHDHRGHRDWRADLHLFPDPLCEQRGYFRWGDELPTARDRPERVFELDNLETVVEVPPAGLHVGGFAVGGESAAHEQLKLYVASHGPEFGLSSTATSHLEYSFATGDRVDVLFKNHLPDRTVVEVEVDGVENVCVGVMQAIKYRSLAAVDAGFPLLTSRVRSLVVAYETSYPKAAELAERYDIQLMSVARVAVLSEAV